MNGLGRFTAQAGTPVAEADPGVPTPEADPEAGTPEPEADPGVPTPGGTLSGDLVVYTSRTEALIKPAIEAFEQANPGVEVVLLTGSDGELSARLLEERNNPQADIDRGIVNIRVGFAPLKPAEFVIIQIQQIAPEPVA